MEIKSPHYLQNTLLFTTALVFFYLSYFLLIPRFYFSKLYWVLCLVFISFVVLAVFLPPVIFPVEHFSIRQPDGLHRPPHKIPLFVRSINSIILFAAVFFLALVIKIQQRLQKSEKEKSAAQLNFLKSQINPHFLFNTLNGIYALTLEKSDKAPEAVVKLSQMMRYVLNESKPERVALIKDLEYLKDFVDLQKMRLGETINIHFTVEGDAGDKTIAPLLLIPFVENAFKHGILPDGVSDIDIRIQITGTALYLTVKNNFSKNTQNTAENSGVGIENARTRLNLLYPAKHKLVIKSDPLFHIVQLQIQLS